jgi:hypothetical protein
MLDKENAARWVRMKLMHGVVGFRAPRIKLDNILNETDSLHLEEVMKKWSIPYEGSIFNHVSMLSLAGLLVGEVARCAAVVGFWHPALRLTKATLLPRPLKTLSQPYAQARNHTGTLNFRGPRQQR